MVLRMRAHLKRGLDYEPLYNPDCFEPVPVEDAAEQEAKRRRILYVAEQYLKGDVPVLLTTCLKGPFNNGWQNPWMTLPETSAREEAGHDQDVSANDRERKAEEGQKSRSRGHPRKIRLWRRGTVERTATTSRSASPEASRAPGAHEELPQFDTVATQDTNIRSSAIEPYDNSVTSQSIHNTTSTNPFWLHRPQTTPNAKENLWNRTNEHISPVQRNRDRQPRPIRELLARHRGHVSRPGTRNISGSSPFNENATCASQSMMISSGNTVNEWMGTTSRKVSPRRKLLPQSAQKAISSPPVIQLEQNRGMSLPASPTHASGIRERVGKSNRTRVPAPGSPTPFIYRKRNVPERLNTVEPEAEMATEVPQAVDEPLRDEDLPATSPGNILHGHDQVDTQTRPTSPPETYPTQAAMLLAQIEFQEGSFSMSSLGSPTAWTHSSEDTAIPEPSPAITPTSTFKIPPSKSYMSSRSIRGPPMSTQDLFGAASPFVFSTSKRDSSSVRQTLRDLVAPSTTTAVAKDGAIPVSSPTPSTRVPLRPKNTAGTPHSSAASEASLEPQKFQDDSGKQLKNDIELLPSLDFQTSLDKVILIGNGDFTDHLFI